MRREPLEITKNNYKGYLEYYQLKKNPLTSNQEMIHLASLVALFILFSYLVSPLSIFYSTKIGFILGILGIGGWFADLILLPKYFENKNQINFKKIYPYIDITVTEKEMESAFKKVNKKFTTTTEDEWENYYACEEIRKEILTDKNREYKLYICESEISEKQVKQKVKVLMRERR